jgi:16S rRNA pseudouridine516 synthase
VRIRLDRLLANLGYSSRREAQALIAAGEVLLDGKPVVQGSAHVQADASLSVRMTVAGEPLDPPSPLTLLLNKPLGAVCSHHEAGRSVYELFPERWRRRTPALSTVGRLDADTSGLIIVTDDGALNHRIIAPRSHVAKRYLATLARPLEGHEAALFASGTLTLEGDDKPLTPAQLDILEPTLARLIIHEGRYHQVRRMFAAAGNHVLALTREAIGGLELPPDLAPGAWRIASAADLAAVFA